MNDFKKWPSIENSYRDKYITMMVNYHPQLLDERYVVTEKVDGSNLQWVFCPDGTVLAGSRNNYLDMNQSFQGASISSLWNDHEYVLTEILNMATSDGVTIRLYGELYGEGIQKRVDYGKGKKLIYFGLMINDEWLSFNEVRELFDNLNAL